MQMSTGDHERQGTTGAVVPAGRGRNVALWIVQILLALLFVLSGVMKFVMPVAKMQEGPVKLPIPFLYFIGVSEVLGGLGLILPGMLRIRRGLTPLAAGGLLIIMAGATVVTLMSGGGLTVLIPLVIGLLTAIILYGRRDWFAA